MAERMSGVERRAQVLGIAAVEFAEHGLYGASTEAIARGAGITQAYVFRMFGTKKALFLELVASSFDRFTHAMVAAAGGLDGLAALGVMGAQYNDLLAERTTLLLQLQGFAACGDGQVRDVVRARMAAMWDAVEAGTGLEAVTVKAFLAFGMLLNAGAALDVREVDEHWAHGIATRITPALFAHITSATNR